MKVLFTTPELEHPPAGGPYLRIENSIKVLNKMSELHIVARVKKENMGGDEAENFYKKHCKKFVYAPSVLPKTKKNKMLREVRRIVDKIMLRKKRSAMQDDISFLLKYAKNNSINIIWFGYGNISYDLMKEVKRLAPNIKIICDTDSVWSRFVLRSLPYAKSEEDRQKILESGKKKEEEEADWVDFCDVTTAVSEIDAQYYRSIARDTKKIKVFSNGIDLSNYAIKPDAPEGFKKPCIYFAGYFGPNSPTDVAARWVINDILPLVINQIPNVHFYIAGKGSAETLSDISHPNVTVTGKLKTVLPYLCNADVSLVPLKFESGTRFKILEAAACGVPIVSTVLGAEGIEVKNGENILIADESKEFAEAIITLLSDQDLAGKIARNCKSYIDSKYGLDALTKEAKEIFSLL